MRTALEATAAGADVQAEAHARVSALCDAIAALQARLAALQGRVEALVPHNAGSVGLLEQMDWPLDDEGAAAADPELPAAAAEDESAGAGHHAEAAAPRQPGSPNGSEGFSSCEELGSDELLEAQEAALAASGLLPMRALPTAAAADDAGGARPREKDAESATAARGAAAHDDEAAAPAAGHVAVTTKPEDDGSERGDSAPVQDQGPPRTAGAAAPPAPEPAAPDAAEASAAEAPQQAAEAPAPAGPAGAPGAGSAGLEGEGSSDITSPLSSYDELASARCRSPGASSAGGNERLADSLLGVGDAGGLLLLAGAARGTRGGDAAAAAPAAVTALPLSSLGDDGGRRSGGASAGGSFGASSGLRCSEASIVPHAEDGGGALSPTADFRRSFAEALSAAGLHGGPAPASASESDDWTLIEGLAADLERAGEDEEEQAGAARRR
ncbi:hypothetical protein MNEG_6655 [Monoraphidium neglectum]|uniref:Uncharacterized protein n=1 Tax=Monoraphidium neglectum TaxID=145388 RepID=A0A0D2ML65_9CHLO|nr:hypothetical protein MNEG_6655 [Monoraphidium neglectum]KIZ01307.1 hypothetical protein MNEG_6655 [Monoraphidium neglectum]|eukprot:XP_013900326.1 hypothetical protein MNEG_6655 [Monoraphidium neglectum]